MLENIHYIIGYLNIFVNTYYNDLLYLRGIRGNKTIINVSEGP